MNFQKQKAELWIKAAIRLSLDKKDRDRRDKIEKAIEAVSVNKIFEQCLHLENVILPSIKKNRGEESSEYKMFCAIAKSLLWAICLVDRNEFMEGRFYNLNIKHELLLEHAARLERQIFKYATLEDLFLSSGLDVMAEGISQRARDLLNVKK